MDRCRWEEFLRLISFIFVRLIIQFRLYVVDRFQIITYVHYIYICISIFPRICFARCIPDPTSYVIQPFSYVFTFHTASHSYYSTRDTFLHPRVFYISFHLLNAHTPFYIRISIYYTPPIRAVLIYSQESYTYRVLLISVDAIFIIFFFTLSPFPFFINLRSFFHPCDPISHIQRPSSRSVKYHSDEFVGIFSDRKYHNYRGIIKNRLDQRQRWFRLRFEVARTPSLSPFSIPSSTLSGGTAGEGACK